MIYIPSILSECFFNQKSDGVDFHDLIIPSFFLFLAKDLIIPLFQVNEILTWVKMALL